MADDKSEVEVQKSPKLERKSSGKLAAAVGIYRFSSNPQQESPRSSSDSESATTGSEGGTPRSAEIDDFWKELEEAAPQAVKNAKGKKPVITVDPALENERIDREKHFKALEAHFTKLAAGYKR